MKSKLTATALATVLYCCSALNAANTTWTWQGNVNSDWTNKANWSTADNDNFVGGGDVVVINDGASAYPYLAANVVMNEFIMNGGWMFLNGYNFNVNNDITMYDGSFHADDSRVSADNFFLYGGEMIIYGDQLNVNDNVVVDGGLFTVYENDLLIPDDLFLTSGTMDLNGNDLVVSDEYIFEGYSFSLLNVPTFSVDNLTIDFAGTEALPFNITVLGNAEFVNGILTTNSGTMLIFDNNASASNAGSTSHVNGPVRRLVANSGNTAFTFPVGNGSVYAPIGIFNFAQARVQDYFTAQYYQSNAPYNHASKDNTLDHVGSAEHWILDRGTNAGTTTTDVFVRLSFDETNRSGAVDNASQLRVTRWDGTKWVDHGRANGTGNNIAGTFSTSARLTNFSPFTIGSSTSLNPLPVTLMEFNAIALEKQVKVSWSTMSEVNNDFFTVQKCLDGKSWSVIGIVNGAENAGQVSNYSFMDVNPVAGVQFYRLIQTDINGESSISNIITVNYRQAVMPSTVSVFPNPVVNTVNLDLGTAITGASITVFNHMGIKVLEMNDQSGRAFTLDMTGFERGVYTVEVRHDDGVSFSKILKN
jgi:hypothetical protein